MTLIAGIVARRGGEVDEEFAQALTRSLSRKPGEVISTYSEGSAFLAKFDIGAYGRPAEVRDPDGSVTFAAGDPILEDSEVAPFRSRLADVEEIHTELKDGRTSILLETRGVFSAAHYLPGTRELLLFSDKLGVRPLYYWYDDDYFVFASALRILEALPRIPRKMDVRAVTEMTTLGIPLGRRTPYLGVYRIGAAELIRVTPESVTTSSYFRWDAIEERKLTIEESAARIHACFTEAVGIRLGRQKEAVAFLSGGMDSRAVVATLIERGAAACTFNFSYPGTQDHAFSTAFAEAIGSRPGGEGRLDGVRDEPRFTRMMARSLERMEKLEGRPNFYPRLVWSGDGGSVGIGHVYMTEEVVALLRQGRTGQAIDLFLNERRAQLHRRVFRTGLVERLSSIPAQGIAEELAELTCRDRGRAFYLFLMLNDQRRHLTPHFETIDEHRIEFELPFYDSPLVEAIIECPLDYCLLHRLYTHWFGLMHPAVRSVPWQTYPGHVPCPLPAPENASYQWDPMSFAALRQERRQRLLGVAAKILRKRDFPSPLLARTQLLLAVMVYAANIRDCGYLLSTAETFDRYWGLCAGEYALQ